MLKKIRPTLFSCPFGIILDLSVTSETFTNWIKFRRKYKYTKIAIGAKMNFAKNESVWIRINLKIFLQFQKVYSPYHISFVSFNDEVGYPKTQSYPRWNNSKNQTQPTLSIRVKQPSISNFFETSQPLRKIMQLTSFLVKK